MATRIIKQGTARASAVQHFSFSQNAFAEIHSTEQSEWMGMPSDLMAASEKAPSPAETANPVPDVASLEKAAYQKGFLQGEKTATENSERKLESAMKHYAESISEIQGFRSSLYKQVEREVVKLALAVAKKIVHREVRIDTEIIQTLVRVALGHVSEKSAVTICLNPEDYAYLLERREDLSRSEGRDIAFLADKSIERGGCLIQTVCGDIDARVEEKFREVEQAFFEGVN